MPICARGSQLSVCLLAREHWFSAELLGRVQGVVVGSVVTMVASAWWVDVCRSAHITLAWPAVVHLLVVVRAGGMLGCLGVWCDFEMFSTCHTCMWHTCITFCLSVGALLHPPHLPPWRHAGQLPCVMLGSVMSWDVLVFSSLYHASQRFWVRATLRRCCDARHVCCRPKMVVLYFPPVAIKDLLVKRHDWHVCWCKLPLPKRWQAKLRWV